MCLNTKDPEAHRIYTEGVGVATCLAAEPGMKQSNYIVDYDYREDN